MIQKRILLIISVSILGIFIVAIGLWFVFFRSGEDGSIVPSDVPVGEQGTLTPAGTGQGGKVTQGGVADSSILPTNTDSQSGGLSDLPQIGDEGSSTASTVAEGRYTAITPTTPSGSFQNISIGGDGSVRYYDQSKGQFVEVGLNQKTTYLSQDAFPSAKQVVWSQSGDKAVVEFPDGYNIIYDFANEKQVTLPKEAEGFSFSPSSQEVAYKMMTTDFWQNWLAVSSTDGESIQNVEHLGDNGVLV